MVRMSGTVTQTANMMLSIMMIRRLNDLVPKLKNKK